MSRDFCLFICLVLGFLLVFCKSFNLIRKLDQQEKQWCPTAHTLLEERSSEKTTLHLIGNTNPRCAPSLLGQAGRGFASTNSRKMSDSVTKETRLWGPWESLWARQGFQGKEKDAQVTEPGTRRDWRMPVDTAFQYSPQWTTKAQVIEVRTVL